MDLSSPEGTGWTLLTCPASQLPSGPLLTKPSKPRGVALLQQHTFPIPPRGNSFLESPEPERPGCLASPSIMSDEAVPPHRVGTAVAEALIRSCTRKHFTNHFSEVSFNVLTSQPL